MLFFCGFNEPICIIFALFQGQHLWRVNVSSGKTLSSEKETVQSYFGLDGQKVTAAFYRETVDEWTIFTCKYLSCIMF